MVDQRGERHANLADDLSNHVQGGTGVLPRFEWQGGPAFGAVNSVRHGGILHRFDSPAILCTRLGLFHAFGWVPSALKLANVKDLADVVRVVGAYVGDERGIPGQLLVVELPEEEYEDIPRLSERQLARMVRLRNVRRKVPVNVRLDAEVLDWLRGKGEGHLTRINDIPTNLMEAERRAGSGK
jgi:uncharacterized protein (DUF4415 family)